MSNCVSPTFANADAQHDAVLTFLVEVVRDESAGVFVATSPDLRGLVLEAFTLDGLVAEMPAAIGSLLSEYLHACT
ncbi:MAG: hypothetical protein JWQ11_1555 [Rhizobacter sp.]|nr:hypothetical protein [Rhizobacter sp.]